MELLKKNTTINTKWIVMSIIFAIFGILILNLVGRLFIREVVQEVTLEGARSEVSIASIGEKAPYWELADLAGQQSVISDFLGEPMMVTFWTSWNQVSADQIKIFDEFLAKDSKMLFSVVTINNQEDRGVVSNFMRRGGYQVRVLLDESGAVGERYDLKTLPVTYFIDKDGFVRDVFTGSLSEEMLLERIEILFL